MVYVMLNSSPESHPPPPPPVVPRINPAAIFQAPAARESIYLRMYVCISLAATTRINTVPKLHLSCRRYPPELKIPLWGLRMYHE